MSEVNWVAGVDEAGRGPLAGSVVASAVILPARFDLPGLTDSKKLSAGQRAVLEPMIQQQAIAWCVAQATCEEVDRINILQATMLAMQRAVMGLQKVPTLVLIDGNRAPDLLIPARCIVKGDLTQPVISAASILAKQERDRQLVALDQQFPQYGFAQHKGYPTKAHLLALCEHGPCSAHRLSFKPVSQSVI